MKSTSTGTRGEGEAGARDKKDAPMRVLLAMLAIPSLLRRNPKEKSSKNVSSTLVAVLPNHTSNSE